MTVYVLLNNKFNDKNLIQSFIDVFFNKDEAYLILEQLKNADSKGHYYIKEFKN